MGAFKQETAILKEKALDFIRDAVLNGEQENFLNIDHGIKTDSGVVDRIDVDKSGMIFVFINNKKMKLEELNIDTILDIANSF